MKRFLTILTILIAVTIGYFVFQHKEEATASWFNNDWIYRQKIEVTNAGSAQTDFQVELTLDTATLVTAGKLQSDCDDIRITDVNGVILKHWVEENNPGCNNASTRIWTKLSSIPTTDPTTGIVLYVYYGNPSAVNNENGSDVFDFFDDFNSATLDSQWSVVASSAYSLSGGILQITQGAIGLQSALSFDLTDGYIFEGRIRYDNNTPSNYGGVLEVASSQFVQGSNAGSDATILYMRTNTTRYVKTWIGSGSAASYNVTSGTTIFTSTDSTWYVLGDGVLSSEARLFQDYSEVANYTASWTKSINYVSLGVFHGVGTYDIKDTSHDWVRIRKFVLTAPTAGSPAAEEVGKAPIGYWKFDEGYGTTAFDRSSSGNDGTASGGVTWKNEEECKVGKCFSFDGVDDEITIASAASLETMTDITVSAWIKADGTQPDTFSTIVRRDPSTGGTRTLYGMDLSSGNLRLTFIGVSSGDITTGTGSKDLRDGTWHHITIVRDNSNTKAYGYIDGIVEIDVSDIADGSFDGDNTPVYIGQWDIEPTNRRFEGLIDEVKIYPYARTVAEIKSEYAAGRVGAGTERGASIAVGTQTSRYHDITGMPTYPELSNGLIAHYKMNDNVSGDAKTIVDAGGNYNGTTDDGANNTGMDCTVGGKFSYGCDFDGTDDVISLSSHISNFTSLTVGTVSGWFKRDTTTNRDIVFAIGESSTSDRFVIEIDSSSDPGKFRVVIREADLNTVDVASVNTFDDLNWHHFAVTNDDVNQVKIYVDGISETPSSPTVNANDWFDSVASKNVMNIGEDDRVTDVFMNGTIDNVRIYNRALSGSEVAMLALTSAPVAHWKFDEKTGITAYDTSGSNDATASGSPTWVPGYYGSALNLDAIDEYMTVPADSSLNNITQVTVSAWVYNNDDTTAGAFVEKSIGDTVNTHFLLFRPSADVNDYGFRIVSSSTQYDITTTGNDVTPNVWTYLAATYDGSVGRLYVNSIERDSATHGVTMDTGSGTTRIGDLFTSGFEHEGFIDDVRIYNYARTQKQIIEDMNAGHPAIGSPVGSYVGYWRFDELYGSTAFDKSINNNDGTITVGGSGTNTTLADMWDPSGKFGSALEFDGTDDYVNIGTDLVSLAGPFSISAWVNADDIDNNIYVIAGASIDGSTATDYFLFIHRTDKSGITLQWDNGAGGAFFPDNASQNLTAGQWHHVVVVNHGATVDRVQLFQDGVEVIDDTTFAMDTPAAGTYEWSVGTWEHSPTANFWKGKIDEVVIYPFALTQDEVELEYNRRSGLKLGTTGTDSSGVPDDSKAREYCIPGDSSTCNPPVAHWRMEERTGTNVYDTSGNGNDGTASGGPLWKGANDCYRGSCLDFDGTDDYVDAGDINAIDGLTTITVSAWVTSRDNMAIASNAVRKEVVFALGGGWTASKARFYINYGSWDNSGDSSTSIDDGNWHHIVGTYDGTDIKIWVNGTEENSTTNAGRTLSSNANVLSIGARDNVTEEWNGLIDDVRIYDYARTPAQIAWDYNRGLPVAWWKMNENEGTTVNDYIGSNNGTLTNATTAVAWVTGKHNYAIDFDGDDDYVVTGTMTLGNNFSVTVWVNSNVADQGSTYDRIIENAYNNHFYLGMDNDGTTYKFIVNNGVSPFGAAEAGTIVAGRWQFLVGTYDGTTGRLYIDNVEVASDTFTAPGEVTDDIGIGAAATGSTPWNGLIDDVRIYNYTLNETQIKQIHNEGAGIRFGPETGTP